MRVLLSAVTLSAAAVALLVGCSSDTAKLNPGDCVKVESVGFSFGGDVETVSCSMVVPMSDYYRVTDVGSESEVESNCRMPDLQIVDEGDSACLTQ